MRRRSETRPAPAEGELGLKLGSEAAASGTRALWGVLAVLVLARGALSFIPNMWCWGLNLQRFVPVGPGWGLWALATLALAPAISRPLAAKLRQVSAARKGGLRLLDIAWGWGLASAVAVWLAPDRMYFVGDFLLRLGAARLKIPTERAFPQAFPLDVFLHQMVPGFLATKFGLEALDAERLLGAFEAGAFAMLAATFARGLGLAGVAAFAATAVVVFGGYLGMFTGYGKAFKEMCVLTAAIGAFGTRVAIQGTGLLPLGLATAIGFALHRSALAFLAPLAVAWWVWLSGHGPLPAWRRPAVGAALALPLVTLGVMAPRMAAVFGSVDRIHVVPSGIAPSQVLAAAFQPSHLTDIASLVVTLSPVAVSIPFMALWLGPPLRRRRELWVLIALALPLAGAMLFIHPRQGVFRDWDIFAPGGVALSLLAAWMIGKALQAAPRLAWVGVAAALGSLAPTAQWLIHHRDVDRGIARVEAFLYEAPRRDTESRAAAFNYLGGRLAGLKRFDASAEAYARAAELGPSSAFLFEWAVAETQRGNLAKAQAIYGQVVGRVPTWFEAWLNLASVSYRRGELVVARQEAERALSIRPRDQAAKNLLQAIERAQAAAPPAAPR